MAHQSLLSFPRSQERTVERHLDVPALQLHVSSATSSKSLQFLNGPGTTWNSHAASNRGTVRRPADLFPFVREFTEVILLRPRQAQRWIPLGNRESHCDATCFGVVPDAGHSVDMAMKAEQFRSGPGAIHCLDTCLRTCSWRDTLCFGCLSKQNKHIIFKKGERTCLGAASRTRSRTHIARILTRIPLKTKL